MKVITDHKWREAICGTDLPEKFHSDFDYIEAEEFLYTERFFMYRGMAFDLHEFLRLEESEWHGYCSLHAFCAVVVRYDSDGERFQVGRAVS